MEIVKSKVTLDNGEGDFREQDLLMGMIIDTKFLSCIATVENLNRYLSQQSSKLLAKWCLDYFGKYGKAPESSILEIVKNQITKLVKKDPPCADMILAITTSLAERYGDNEEVFDFQYQLDQAEMYLQSRAIGLRREEEERLLEAGEVLEAAQLPNPIINLHQVEVSRGPSLVDALSGDCPLAMQPSDIMNLEFPGKQYHMFGDFPLEKGSITLVSGDTGGGKTWFLQEITKIISSGDYGLAGTCHASEPQKVLYVDGELSHQDLRDRITALELDGIRHMTIISKSLLEKHDVKPPLNLSEASIRETLFDYIVAGEFEVVVLDNIYSLFTSLDLDSAKEWSPINDFLLRLRAKGISTILCHHVNKAKDQSGTISKLWNINYSLQLKKETPPKDKKSDCCCFSISIKKQRNQGIRLTGKKYCFNDNVWSIENIRVDDSKVRKAIILQGLIDGISQTDIATLAKCTKQFVGKIKKAEIEGGVLIEDGESLTLSKEGELFISEWYKENYFNESNQEE